MKGARAGRAAGFTLVELVAALAVLVVTALMVAELADETRILAHEAGRELAAPDPTIALARLRRDLRGAARAHGAALATGAPLVLEGHPAGRIRYERIGGRLERTLEEPSGRMTAATVLHGVAGWSWSEAAPGLVEIRLAVRRPRRGRGQGLERLRQAAGSQVESHELAVVLRGAGRGRSW